MSHPSLARRTMLRSLAGAGLIAVGAGACAATDDSPRESAAPSTSSTADQPSGNAPGAPSAPGPGDQFPDREIVPLQIDTIASGGGGIHCSTHDQPAG